MFLSTVWVVAMVFLDSRRNGLSNEVVVEMIRFGVRIVSCIVPRGDGDVHRWSGGRY